MRRRNADRCAQFLSVGEIYHMRLDCSWKAYRESVDESDEEFVVDGLVMDVASNDYMYVRTVWEVCTSLMADASADTDLDRRGVRVRPPVHIAVASAFGMRPVHLFAHHGALIMVNSSYLLVAPMYPR